MTPPIHLTHGRARRANMCAPRGKWVTLDPKESCDLTIAGSGILRKLWCVFNATGKARDAMTTLTQHRDLYRNVWIHIAFDDADVVQVSAPIADFFLCGHGDLEDVDSHYFQSVRIPPLEERPYQAALTSFAPMPFARCAKISLANRNTVPVRLIASFDWIEREASEKPVSYFHATYTHRRLHNGPMVLLDTHDGEGELVGVGLYVNNRDRALRWHEWPERIWVDEKDLLVGTGGEDYFCQAWGFRRRVTRAHFGVTCVRPHGGSATLPAGGFNPAGEYAMYRLHLHDSVSFTRSLKLSFGAEGVAQAGKSTPLEFRSVVFWYGRAREQ